MKEVLLLILIAMIALTVSLCVHMLIDKYNEGA